VPVLVDHSGEPFSAAYVQAGDPPEIGDRLGDRTQRCWLVHRSMGPVGVVVQLEPAEGVAQVALDPDEGAVQKFVAAGLDPALMSGIWTPVSTVWMPTVPRI
jgi:hypothetical protein